MPLRSKKSRAAKHARRNACTTFVAPAPRTPSPEGSEYVDSDDSVIDVESDDELDKRMQGGNGVKLSVEVIQQLYSVFLPPHLHLEEKRQEKHQRTENRKAVYSGDLQMTIWRKKTALKCAAEGSRTLDSFMVIKVCLLSVKQ